MTKTIARFALPAALVLASFGAQAGEGPIDVRVQPAAAQTAGASASMPMTSTSPAGLIPGA